MVVEMHSNQCDQKSVIEWREWVRYPRKVPADCTRGREDSWLVFYTSIIMNKERNKERNESTPH